MLKYKNSSINPSQKNIANIKFFSPVRIVKFQLEEPYNHFIKIWVPETIFSNFSYESSKNRKVLYESGYEDIKMHKIDKGVNIFSEIPSKIRVESRLIAIKNRIEIHHTITNLSKQNWENVLSNICVQLSDAPIFKYRNASEVYYAGHNAFHTFKYKEDGLWKFLNRDSDKDILHPLIMVKGKQEKYVIGFVFPSAKEVGGNGNHSTHCIHSSPIFESIDKGTAKTEIGIVFIIKGDLEDALKYYLDWKEDVYNSIV